MSEAGNVLIKTWIFIMILQTTSDKVSKEVDRHGCEYTEICWGYLNGGPNKWVSGF